MQNLHSHCCFCFLLFILLVLNVWIRSQWTTRLLIYGLCACFCFVLYVFKLLIYSFRLVPIYTTPITLHGTGTRTTNKLKTQPAPGVPQIAHPNDRATSVRPAKRNENVKWVTKCIYTKLQFLHQTTTIGEVIKHTNPDLKITLFFSLPAAKMTDPFIPIFLFCNYAAMCS